MAFLRTHLSCDECGSSDARSVNVDGSSYCFSCNHFTPPDDDLVVEYSKPVRKKVNMNFKSHFDDNDSPSVSSRRLTKATAERYGVTSDAINYYFPYYDSNGTLVAAKVRSKQEKKFSTEGEWAKSTLFGQQLFSSGGKYVTITEGEFDALAAFQATGSKWPSVSIRNGATGALKDCRAAYEWLNSFETIVVCFDNDEPGKKAAKEVAELFGSKAKVYKHDVDMKDACDYVAANKEAIFVHRWWSAEPYVPDGIVAGTNLWDLVSTPPAPAQCMYPWEGLNGLTYGIRHGELVTITAGSGLGKSQLLREIVWHIICNTDDNVGLMFLEEGIRKTGLSVMSLAANKPLHLPDTVASDEERKDAFERTLGTGRLFLFDHFGSTSVDNIVNRVRYMAKALNCKYVFVDHISIIVSAQENGDERKAIDEIMTKLRMLVQETNIALFVVSHLKRPSGVGHEEGAATSLAQLRGSGSIAQLSDIVLGAERNGQEEDMTKRNTTYLRVLKNRYSGMTGPACSLLYTKETGRMLEYTPAPDDDEEDNVL
jgi:twinkle protein